MAAQVAMESLMQHIVPGANYTAEGVVSATFATNVAKVRGRLAAAPLSHAWQVALHIVDVERWHEQAESMVVPPLMMPGMVFTGAGMVASFVEVLSELDQHIRAGHAGTLAAVDIDCADVRPTSILAALADLQQNMGLLTTLQQIFSKVAQQRQAVEQSGSSSCALGHGPKCPAAIAAAAMVPSAPAATGAGPPCRSCQLAHAELLAACSALLRYWPECVLGKERVTWAWAEAAAECALHMLQDVSTAILQHQPPHADGVDSHQQPAPPADVLQLGLAALDLLAEVCTAASYPKHPNVCRRNLAPTLCDRDMLDSSCVLPSMLAVGAAAVLGTEMMRRLRRTAAACAGSRASSAAAAASSEGTADADAAVLTDQAGQCATAAACSSNSTQDSTQAAGRAGAGLGAIEAAWRLVCVTEQWAGGQLLPQPFTLLLEGLDCSPKAFLMLACIWQQQQQQAATCNHNSWVLPRLSRAYYDSFYLERGYITHYLFPQAGDSLLRRLSDCHAKGQHHPQHTHLLLALLLTREAVSSGFRGMFNSAAVSASPQVCGHPLQAATFAADCVSTWLCWAQFNRQQQQEAQQGEPAAVGGPATAPSQRAAPSQPWALGGESSSAVLLEVLQGQCRLLKEGVRELQAVTSSWAARSSGEQSSSSNSGNSAAVDKSYPDLEASYIDVRVKDLLNSVCEMLRALLAAAAVDIKVLQQAAPHLFRLAGTLEQLVRLRCACHHERLRIRSDWSMLQLLSHVLGSRSRLVDLSAYTNLRQEGQTQQPPAPAAAPRGHHLLKACGLLPFLAVFTWKEFSSKRQQQLLGLLFSSLKLFSTYPTGLYASECDHQDDWLAGACNTIRAVCTAGRLLLVTGQGPQQGQDSTQPGGVAEGQGSSSHSCGLGAEGTAALLPWVVLQGRALQLWVALFRAYVQLPPAAEGSKAAARSAKVQDSSQQPQSLVGTVKALNLLAAVFEDAVAPSTQVLAVVLQGAQYRCELPPQWQSAALVNGLMASFKQAISTGRLLYGVPSCLWPPTSLKKVAQEDGWLQQRLARHGQQLQGHCREQGLDPRHLKHASGLAAATVLQVLHTLAATSEGLKQLGDSAQTQHRLRQSDVRRYLKSWEVGDAAVLKGVLAMLSDGEHSAADVAVAAWLCSPSIAGDLLAQLQEFSSELSTLPIHEACNNPACRITAGSREQGLVSGKACVCAGCMMGHYCSRACQREHWLQHKEQCEGVAAERRQ